jgi:hypothetical protein
VLVGDVANGGLKAYREGQVPEPQPQVPDFSLTASLVGGQIKISWTEPGTVLQESTNLTTWTDLPTATSPYTSVPGGRNLVYYRLKK